MRRVEIEDPVLCKVPGCGNEVESPREGLKAGMCTPCAKGDTIASRLYHEALERGDARVLESAFPNRRSTSHTTPTEMQIGVLRGIARGWTNAQIASATFRSEDTIKTHVKRLLDNMGANNRAHLVAIAFERGLLP